MQLRDLGAFQWQSAAPQYAPDLTFLGRHVSLQDERCAVLAHIVQSA